MAILSFTRACPVRTGVGVPDAEEALFWSSPFLGGALHRDRAPPLAAVLPPTQRQSVHCNALNSALRPAACGCRWIPRKGKDLTITIRDGRKLVLATSESEQVQPTGH